MALRQQLVDYIQDNFQDYVHFLFNNNQAGTVNEQVEDLRGDGVWASEAGDLVPMAAANAFGVHINLYNIEDHQDRDVIQLVPIRSSRPTSIFVSIMRVRQGHFQLLWPRSGEVQSNSSAIPSSSFPSSSLPSSATRMIRNLPSSSLPSFSIVEKDVLSAAHTAVQAAQVAVSIAKKVSSPSSSLTQNERVLNQISRNLNQLSLGSSSGPRRSTRASSSKPKSPPRNKSKRKASTRKKNNASFYVNNNNNLQRALEESLQYN